MISKEDIDDIKRTTDLKSLVESYGVKLKKEGTARLKGLCPFHEESTPSFYVNVQGAHQDTWHCYGCDTHGDVVDFVQRIEGANFARAIENLGHGQIRQTLDPRRKSPRKKAAPVDPWPEYGASDVFSALRARKENEPDIAAKWLTEARHIDCTGPAYRDCAGTAFVTPHKAAALPDSLKGKNGSPREVLRHQLRQHGNAVAFPIRSAKDNIIKNIRYRFTAPPGKTKIVGMLGCADSDTDGTPRGYGYAGACLRADTLVVTEGAIDTLIAELLVYPFPPYVAVGAVSASGLSLWARWLAHKRFQGRVVFVYHRDQAGRQATEQARQTLLKAKIQHELFDWSRFAHELWDTSESDITKANDLGDVAKLASWPAIESCFLHTLRGVQ